MDDNSDRAQVREISIKELNLYQEVPKGEEKVLQFQALQKGEFVFECAKHCSSKSSAKGTIFVK